MIKSLNSLNIIFDLKSVKNKILIDLLVGNNLCFIKWLYFLIRSKPNSVMFFRHKNDKMSHFCNKKKAAPN
jgi:hypothetical protein